MYGNDVGIFSQSIDGSGETVQLIKSQNHGSADWSINGEYLAYHEAKNGNNRDLWYLPKDQSNPMPFLQTQFQEALPTLPPDGKYVAYQSNKSGTYEIYVKPFPVGNGEWTISDNRGRHPLWSRQGDEIFYIEKNTMMAVPGTIKQTFSREHPQKLFSGEQVGSLFMDDGDFGPHYDVSADGQRFVVVQNATVETSKRTVVQN